MDIFQDATPENFDSCSADYNAGISARIFYARADSFEKITLPANPDGFETSVVIPPADLKFYEGFGWSHLDCLIDENELRSALSPGSKKSISTLEIFALGLDAKKLCFIELLKYVPLVFLVPDSAGQFWLVGNLRNRANLEKAETTSARKYEENSGTLFNIISKSQLYRYGGDVQVIDDTQEVIDISGSDLTGSYPSGKIYIVNEEPTGTDLARFSFPLIFMIVAAEKSTHIVYDAFGNRYVGGGSGGVAIVNFDTFADLPIPGDISTIYKTLDTDELYVWDSETETYILSSIDDVWKMAVDQGIASALTTLSGVLEEMADIQLNKANKDASEMSPANIISWQDALNIHNLQIALDAEIVNRALADNNLQNQINTNNAAIADLNAGKIEITTTTSITTNTVGTISGKSQHYRTVLIKNGVNAINIECKISSNPNFTACYYKMGSGTITFIKGDADELVLIDSENKLNGAIGSTAVLTRDGNKFYLRISNA